MPVVNKKEKVFPGAGTKIGVEIWRVENFIPQRVPVEEHGTFYKGDSYIILKTHSIGSKADIFFWLGPESSQDEMGAAAQLAVTLDEELGGFPVQHRVVGGREDNIFKGLFNRITVRSGGYASGFREGKKIFRKALIRVKGKRKTYATEVPLSTDSLNIGDSFVLDCGLTLYIWHGKEANRSERLGATLYAKDIRDNERAGAATVIVVGDQAEEEAFFSEITGLNRIVRITKEASHDESFTANKPTKSNLFRVKEDESGNITMKESGSQPLSRKDLDSDDVFILETNSAVYVWQGKKSSRNEKSQAHKDAQGFISARSLDPHTACKIVKEGMEPAEFKQFFNWWEPVVSYGNAKTYSAGRGVVTREELDRRPKFEVKSLHSRRVSVTSYLPDDGTGEVELYRVKQFELEEVPKNEHGIFYSGDCYVVVYTYLKNSKEHRIIYFWLGNDSTLDEQGAAAGHAISLDDKYNGEPYQVRVCEGHEPEHFFLIFHHLLVIYQGGYASGFRSVKQETASSEVRLLQVRVHKDDARIVEVPPLAQSLNSSDAFVLHSPNHLFVWCGRGSIGDEVEYAKSFSKKIGSGEYDLLSEGKEKSQFWNLLGGKAEYATEKEKGKGAEENPDEEPRLFLCSNASGRFLVEEILNFSQADLVEDDVMILDTYSQLFIWVGKDARREEKRDAIQTAVEYVRTDPRQRAADMTMSVIKQGSEPAAFKSYFLAWEPQMWNKKMTYDECLNEIRHGNNNVDVEALKVSEWSERLKPQTFSLEVLLRNPDDLPEEVDPTKKEQHLSDEEFQQVFSMTKHEWEKVPQWKRNQKKKEVNLF